MAGLQTEGRNRKTVTSTTGQPLEELARQLVHTDLEMARYPDDQSDTDIVEEYMNKVSLYKGQHPWCHRIDSLNNDGHQFHQYQQNKQSL